MPLEDTQRPSSGPRISVRASATVELCWVLHAAQREDFRTGRSEVGAFFAAHPQLLERAESFWDDDASDALGFLEFLVLAHHGGLLFAQDVDAWGATVAELVPSVPAHLPLRSESDDDRRVVEQRLARLRRSSRLRDAYGRLLDDVWAALRPAWQRARPAVQAACADRRERLARGEPWSEVVRGECDFGGLAQRLVNELGGDDELVIVPAFFTHKGLLLDLPRLVLVGVRADAADAAARVRSEALARRLKSLADPTRLAIVDQLAQHPRTVTELARSFGIAQPTVSNHVKLLRDAGLVHDVRVGPRRQLEVDRPALAQLLEHLGSVVTPPVSDRVSG